MSKYTQPGDADAMQILQAEYAQEQRDLESVRKKLDAEGVSANDAANLQMEVVRRRENLRALEREMQNWTKRTGVSQSANVQPTPASSPTSARVSVSGPAAAIPSAPTAGGIGEYVTGIIRDQMARQDAAIKAQKEGVTKSSQADAAVTMANNDRSNAINSNRLLVQAQAGLGPQAKEDMYAATMAKLAENDQKYASARANYDKYATVNMMEDPLGWLWAQLNIDAAGAQVNQLAAQENILTAALERNMLLSERAETTIQIDTRATDAQIADFKARKQLADAAANVAALEAEGARASMSAAATYGGEVRKDQKTEAQLKEDEVLRRLREEQLSELEAKRKMRETISGLTGAPTSDQALDNLPPKEKAELQAYGAGGSMSPMTMTKLGAGLRASPQDAPLYRTAEQLNAMVRERAAQYSAWRRSGNVALSGKVTWKPTDDEQVAWEELQSELSASNSNRDAKTAKTLTDPSQDSKYNPLRPDHQAFTAAVKQAAAVGAETPVSSRNFMVDMFAKLQQFPQARTDKGQVKTEYERNAVLGAVARMAVEGTIRDQSGKVVTPAGYAATVAQYYTAAVNWNQNRNQLSRLGFPRQNSYIASVPLKLANGTNAAQIVDLTNAAEVERWLQRQIKEDAAGKAQDRLNEEMLRALPSGEVNPFSPQF